MSNPLLLAPKSVAQEIECCFTSHATLSRSLPEMILKYLDRKYYRLVQSFVNFWSLFYPSESGKNRMKSIMLKSSDSIVYLMLG